MKDINPTLAIPACNGAIQENIAAKDKNWSSDQFKRLMQSYYRAGRALQKAENYDRAQEMYERAADPETRTAGYGYAPALHNLGVVYYEGIGVEKDYSEAFKWTYKAADQSFAPAEYLLGVLYYNGQGVSPDVAEAVKWFRRAAGENSNSPGYALAQFELGRMYYNGTGLPKDEPKGTTLIKKAAEQGNEKAKEFLQDRGKQIASGPSTGAPAAATDQCERLAANPLERKLHPGVRLEDINPTLAISACTRAIQENISAKNSNWGDSQFNLLIYSYYRAGRALQKAGDYAAAMAMYEQAADPNPTKGIQGYGPAQHGLGFMYYEGLGVQKDYAKALKWFHRAAKDDLYPPAQFALGVMYENGRGVSENLPEAAGWFRRAAAQGHAPSQAELGRMYWYGRGVSEDEPKGIALLKQAAGQGNERAKKILADIEKETASGGSSAGTAPACGQEFRIFPASRPCGRDWRPPGQWPTEFWCYSDFNYSPAPGSHSAVTRCTDGQGTWLRSGWLDPCDGKEGWCKGTW